MKCLVYDDGPLIVVTSMVVMQMGVYVAAFVRCASYARDASKRIWNVLRLVMSLF